MQRGVPILWSMFASVVAAPAMALSLASVSPQGEVAQVRQVVAKFDDSAVNFGDPKAAAPLSLSCSDAQVTQGTGRWLNDRTWVFDFADDLPPGVACTLQVRSGFQSPKGAELSGGPFKFNTGGPFVQSVRPYSGSRIDEEQFFTLAAQWRRQPGQRAGQRVVRGGRPGRARARAPDCGCRPPGTAQGPGAGGGRWPSSRCVM